VKGCGTRKFKPEGCATRRTRQNTPQSPTTRPDSARTYLEVRTSNEPAITLYMRRGFTECGRRARYYRDPVEDGVLLSFGLGGTH
jgi:ribosomal protein S18 acetylase RimI-like enzyme